VKYKSSVVALFAAAMVASGCGGGSSADASNVAVSPPPAGGTTPPPSGSAAPAPAPAPTPAPTPPPTNQIAVATAAQLRAAVDTANSRGGNVTIALANGTYSLTDTLYINAPNVAIASQSGDRTRVIIEGDAMSASARVGNLIRVGAKGFQLRGVTLQKAGWHLVQIAGEADADNAVLRDCVLRDAYQQLVKVSRDTSVASTADGGLVENCVFEYSAGIGPQYYIGGIDAHGARNWTVRGNTFRDIASPDGNVAEFAVHFWSDSSDNIVERNTIIDCDRGIGFGLDGRGNRGGVIRNNFVYHSANGDPQANVGIALIDSPGSRVFNNTVFFENNFGWSIEYRFSSTTNVQITNNLTNRQILSRDGGSGSVSSNFTAATRAMFRMQSPGDLRLVSAVPSVVDAGLPVTGLAEDIDGRARPRGAAPDLGAFEF
jgi:hypothetical protein